MGNIFIPSYPNPSRVLEQLKREVSFPPSFVFLLPKLLFSPLNSLLLLYRANKAESNYSVNWRGEMRCCRKCLEFEDLSIVQKSENSILQKVGDQPEDFHPEFQEPPGGRIPGIHHFVTGLGRIPHLSHPF